jgi:hypothetical protein
MGHAELTIKLLLKAEGRAHELVRTALNAVQDAGGQVEDAQPLWTKAFQNKVARVLVGTHKIERKTPEELARTLHRAVSIEARKAAIGAIENQQILIKLATDETLQDILRREAFVYIQDESLIARYAKLPRTVADLTNLRIGTMYDADLLFDLAMNAISDMIQWLATKRLITVSPPKALEVAILNVRDNGHGVFYLGVLVAQELQRLKCDALLQALLADPRTPRAVINAAKGIRP